MLKPYVRPYIHIHVDPLYSVVVNRSQYRPDKLAKREMDIGNTPSLCGQFDGYRNDLQMDSVPNELIWLREGRLDKAEIDKLRENIKDKVLTENAQAQIEIADLANKVKSEKMDKVMDKALAIN